MWSGSFALTSGYLRLKRGVDDEWNDTIGGGLTAFLVNIRSGGFSFALNQGVQMAMLFYVMERMLFGAKRKEAKEAEERRQREHIRVP